MTEVECFNVKLDVSGWSIDFQLPHGSLQVMRQIW